MFALPFRRAFHTLVISGVLLVRAVSGEDAVPAPINIDKDVAAYIAIPDFKALLNTAEGIVKQAIPPEQFKPGMLAAEIGKGIGDPTLASLSNKPIVLILFKAAAGYDPAQGPPPAALYIPMPADTPVLEKVKEALANNDKAQGAYEDGLLIVSTPNAMDKAKAAKGLYTKITDAKLQSDARIFISLASIYETFGPAMKAGLDQTLELALEGIKADPPPPQFGISTELIAQLVRVTFKGLKGFAEQADAVQLDIKLKPDSIQIEKLFAAKPGTLLADVFSGNPVAANNVQSFLTKGFIASYMNLDMKNYAAAYKKALAEITADPQTAELAKHEIATTTLQMLESVGGEQISVVGAGAAGPDAVSVSVISDPAKYVMVMDKMMSWIGPESPVAKLYEGMGMKFHVNFQKTVRQHAGTDIHRMSFTMDMPGMPPQEAEKMKAMMPVYELTVAKGYALMATNAAALNAMLDKIDKGDFSPSGITLKSQAAFGKNKNVYIDYDLIGYMKFIMAKVAPAEAGAVFQNLKANDPLLIAYAQGNGRAMFQINMPLAPVLDLVKTVHAISSGPPKVPETTKQTF